MTHPTTPPVIEGLDEALKKYFHEGHRLHLLTHPDDKWITKTLAEAACAYSALTKAVPQDREDLPTVVIDPHQAAVILTHIEKEKAAPWMIKIIGEALQQPSREAELLEVIWDMKETLKAIHLCSDEPLARITLNRWERVIELAEANAKKGGV